MNTLFTADDWGLSPGVNDGILELAARGVLRRVSILAGAEHLTHGLKQLIKLADVKLGLHWNLTYGSPSIEELRLEDLSYLAPKGRYPNLKNLCLLWAKNRERFIQESRFAFLGQFERLSSYDVRISYLDGHQHVHLLPGLIESIGGDLRNFGLDQVRLPLDSQLFFSRRFPVFLLARSRKQIWKRLGLSALPFRYPSPDELMSAKQWVGTFKVPTEILVHPAARMDFEELGITDPYREERVTEYLHLKRLVDLR